MYHMYMKSLPSIIEFDWDDKNIDKSYKKHGVEHKEAEEIFFSENLFYQADEQHSQTEERFRAIGQTRRNKILFVVFTIRDNKIRIISARKMHQKEVEKYEKLKKNS